MRDRAEGVYNNARGQVDAARQGVMDAKDKSREGVGQAREAASKGRSAFSSFGGALSSAMSGDYSGARCRRPDPAWRRRRRRGFYAGREIVVRRGEGRSEGHL